MRRQRATTLIEMIVVLTIILVLSATITAGIVAGIRAAKISDCAANLKGIHQASVLYAGDHDGYLPPVGFFATDAMKIDVRALKVALARYGAVSNIWFCRLDSHAGTSFMGEWVPFQETSYSMTHEFFTLAVSSVKSPFMSFENLPKSTAEITYYTDQPILVEVEAGRSRISAHGNWYNAVFADGHTKHVRVPQP